MKLWIPIGLTIILATGAALAREQYPGQYAQYSDEERAWFKGVKSPRGVPCCDVADGHRTVWRSGKEGYEVPITDDEGVIHWRPVPPEALIKDSKNPTNDSIVWYRDFGPQFPDDSDRYYIRCLVLGPGA